jgi:hypothetical protein
VCRPEIYRVKETIEAALLCFVRALESESASEEPSEKRAKISFVEEMLPLHQRLLCESYDPHHDSYEIVNFNGESCDFCGACLWFCAMRCTSCIKPLDDASPEMHHAFLLCPACYVDGRSCPCKVMEPVQTGSFQELLDLENKAVELLNLEHENLGVELQRIPMSEE